MAMHRFIFTIGFTGKTAEEFFALLQLAKVETVIDIRQNRGGQLSAFAKHPDLAYFLAKTEIDYKHEPVLAPTPDLRKKYQSDNDWDAYELAFGALLKDRGVPQTLDTSQWPARIALLCTEPGPEKCHRRLVADVLVQWWRATGDQVQLEHLISDRKKGKASKSEPALGSTLSTSTVGKLKNEISGVMIAGSAAVLGSRRVLSQEVDRAFGMPLGKLRDRAGIESVSYAAADETEINLGASALQQALQVAGCPPGEIDWIITTSETYREYPSFAPQMHKRVGARVNCGALDVGGACLGLLNALAVAQSFIQRGVARAIAIVTADLHSRDLSPRRVSGEFGGLFGDGASAFVLRAGPVEHAPDRYMLGKFIFGCASQYADAICVADTKDGGLAVQFDGDALSRAAITSLGRVIEEIEEISGISRADVGAFATHQPNPRLVALLAKQCNISASSFPGVARTAGNLGSSTCGVTLHTALQSAPVGTARKPIFLASLGPGLLFGGGCLS